MIVGRRVGVLEVDFSGVCNVLGSALDVDFDTRYAASFNGRSYRRVIYRTVKFFSGFE